MSKKNNSLFKRAIKSNDGFGIVELLVTIVILGFGITSILMLMGSIVRADKISRVNLVSLNLGREGIEIIRNIRDTNWLAGNQWDAGLNSGTDYTAILEFDPDTNSFALDFNPNDIGQDSTKLYFDNIRNFYTHDSDYDDTEYKRILNLEIICRDSTTGIQTIKGSGLSCDPTERKIGIQATVTVRWQEGNGRRRDMKVINKFYNWR